MNALLPYDQASQKLIFTLETGDAVFELSIRGLDLFQVALGLFLASLFVLAESRRCFGVSRSAIGPSGGRSNSLRC